jgi:hypothetical protein
MQMHVVTARRTINHENIFWIALLNTRPLFEKFSDWRSWNSGFAMRIAIEKNRCDQIAEIFSVTRETRISFWRSWCGY